MVVRERKGEREREREREIFLDPAPLSLPFSKKYLKPCCFFLFFIGFNGERGF